jgi:hypothetical protein
MIIIGCPLIPTVCCTGVSGLVGDSTGNPGTKSLWVEVEVDPEDIVESSVAGSGIEGKGKFG